MEKTVSYVGDIVQDYRMITPWKFNVSAGTTLGGIMALGAEYEYANFGSSRLYYNDGTPMDNQNEYTKSTLKGQHTLRVGMNSYIFSF